MIKAIMRSHSNKYRNDASYMSINSGVSNEQTVPKLSSDQGLYPPGSKISVKTKVFD